MVALHCFLKRNEAELKITRREGRTKCLTQIGYKTLAICLQPSNERPAHFFLTKFRYISAVKSIDALSAKNPVTFQWYLCGYRGGFIITWRVSINCPKIELSAAFRCRLHCCYFPRHYITIPKTEMQLLYWISGTFSMPHTWWSSMWQVVTCEC